MTSFTANNVPAAGRTTTWTAVTSGGAGPLQYAFWRLDRGGWQLAQAWGPSNAYTWTPTVNDAGAHTLQVWIRNAGSVAPYDTWAGVTFSIALPTLSVTLQSPTIIPAANTGSASWTATASGGTGAYLYEFWRHDTDGWHLGQPYGPSNTYTWSPVSADAGPHWLQVWVPNADASSAWEAVASSPTFVVPLKVSVLFTLQPASVQASPYPRLIGPDLHWQFTVVPALLPPTSSDMLPQGFEAEVWRYDAGIGWQLVQPDGSSNHYDWAADPSDTTLHSLQVWVRRVGSTAAYDAWVGTG